MKTANKSIIQTVLETDQTVTDHQREGALAILNGDTPPITPLLLKQGDVASLLNVSRQTVWTLTKKGVLSPVKLTSGLSRYKRDQILEIVNGEMAVK